MHAHAYAYTQTPHAHYTYTFHKQWITSEHEPEDYPVQKGGQSQLHLIKYFSNCTSNAISQTNNFQCVDTDFLLLLQVIVAVGIHVYTGVGPRW